MRRLLWLICLLLIGCSGFAAQSFRVATYNLLNYLDAPSGGRAAKTAESKAAVRDTILLAKPDVLAVQEIGLPGALNDLRSSLRAQGLDYSHWEHAKGYDTNIFVAVLSRYPIVARRSHTNQAYLLYEKRFRVSRAFAEVDIKINDSYTFTLITAHLKSRRPVPQGDEKEMREQEAICLRRVIDSRLKAAPDLNLVVLGDFNDLTDSPTMKTLRGRQPLQLLDTVASEMSGEGAWTYYYDQHDTYSRVDYILASTGMAREWRTNQSRVLSFTNWAVASDHRLTLTEFWAENR